MTQSNVAQKVIDHVGYASAALDKAEQVVEEKRANDEKCTELIPDAVEALASKGLIEVNEKEAAAEALQDHAKAIEILTKTAERHEESAVGALGKPTQKAAAYNSLASPYVGGRTTEIKESDLRLFEGMGIPLTEN